MEKLVLFDVDGPIFDQEWFQLKDKVRKHIESKYGYKAINEKGNKFTDIYNCTEEEQIKIWTKFILEYSLFYEPKPWIKELFNNLKKENVKVGFLTAKPKVTEDSFKGKILKLLFEIGLAKHGIKPDFIKYVSLKNSALEKTQFVEEISADLVVEDTTENIIEISKKTPVIVQNTKSNLDEKLNNSNIVRVSSVDEMYINICKILNINFQNFELKNKKEIDKLNLEEKKLYYQNLLEVMKQMPFDKKQVEKKEKHQTNLSNILKKTYGNIFDITVNGAEKIPDGPCIFVSNHIKFEDHYLISSALKNNYHTLFKKEIKEKLISKLLDYIGTIYVERGYKISNKAAIHEMIKYLVNNFSILVFPEGTYRREEYPLKEFADGAFLLAQMTGFPVVPLVINYCSNKSRIVDVLDPVYINCDDKSREVNKNNTRIKMSNKILENDSLKRGNIC